MKNKVIIQIIATVILFTTSLNAQEFKNYNLYNQNPILFNPSLAIGDDLLMAYSNSHLQWISLTGAPRTYDLGATINFFPNMGAGFSVVSSQHGLFNNLYANLKYGYQLELGDNQSLKMGVSLGMINNRVLSQNAENVDLTDDNLSTNYYNKTVFSTGFGLSYKYKDINAQIILPQLIEYNTANLYTIGILDYNYHLNDNFDIKPSVMFRGAKGTPFQFDGNIQATWKKMLWAQAGYRSNKSMIFSVGFNMQNYAIGYAYQADMNPITYGSSGSHEIQLIFRFNKDNSTPLFTPKVNLYGTVTSNLDGKPVVSQITIYEDRSQVGRLRTDSKDGKYAIELSSEKTYKIKVTAKGYLPSEELVTLTKDMKEYEHNIVLISKNAIVTGTTSNKRTGNPAEAEVLFMVDNKIIKNAKSDENGNYSAILTPGKTYKIKVKSNNFEELESEIEIPKNTDKISKDFELIPILTLSGKITDAKTGKPISANIDLYNISTNKLIANVTSDANGNYHIKLTDASNVSISVSAANYLFTTENFKIDFSIFENKKDIQLKLMETGASIILRNVFFDTGKSDLRPESYTEIDRLILIMMQNPTLKIEISGHTDNTGNDNLNDKLSKDRAQSLVDYMVSKGIKKDRLISEGYGSSRPIDTNDTEEGKQNNRRVEAKIIEE